MLKHAPVLLAPSSYKPFKLAVDAAIVAGEVLLQEDENVVDHPFCYFLQRVSCPNAFFSII